MRKSLFNLSNKRKIKLVPNAIETMFSFTQDNVETPESGGIMVGRILDDDLNCIIDDISTPMPKDQQTRYRFNRTPNGHQEFFNVKWDESKGRCFYMGEWHTHPESIPFPSKIDFRNWKKLMVSPPQGQLFLFFIIVGTEQLGIWQGENQNGIVTIGYVGGIERYDW
jgi:integrative and conjugative element protein (TIGR02256 family)